MVMLHKVFLDTEKDLLVYTTSDTLSLTLKIDYGLKFLFTCYNLRVQNPEWGEPGRMPALTYTKTYPLSVTQVALGATPVL